MKSIPQKVKIFIEPYRGKIKLKTHRPTFIVNGKKQFEYPDYVNQRHEILNYLHYQIMKSNDLTTTDIKVLLCLYSHLNKNFRKWGSYPSRETIGKSINRSNATVDRSIKKLFNNGWISVQKRFQRSSKYYFDIQYKPFFEANHKKRDDKSHQHDDENKSQQHDASKSQQHDASKSHQQGAEGYIDKNHQITKSELQHHAKGCLGTADFEKFKNHIQFKPSTDISYLAKQNKNDLVKCYQQICQELHIQIY